MNEVEGRGEAERAAGGGDLLSGRNEVDGRGELGEAGTGGFLTGGGVRFKPPIVVKKRSVAPMQREESHQHQ